MRSKHEDPNLKMQDENSPLKFPCDFPIKIVGRPTPEFETFVYATAHKHFPNLAENAFQQRFSKDKSYLAITVIVAAQSKEQIDNFYLELTANKEVLFVL